MRRKWGVVGRAAAGWGGTYVVQLNVEGSGRAREEGAARVLLTYKISGKRGTPVGTGGRNRERGR